MESKFRLERHLTRMIILLAISTFLLKIKILAKVLFSTSISGMIRHDDPTVSLKRINVSHFVVSIQNTIPHLDL